MSLKEGDIAEPLEVMILVFPVNGSVGADFVSFVYLVL